MLVWLAVPLVSSWKEGDFSKSSHAPKSAAVPSFSVLTPLNSSLLPCYLPQLFLIPFLHQTLLCAFFSFGIPSLKEIRGERETLTDLCQIAMHSFSLPFETGDVEARNLFQDAAKWRKDWKYSFFATVELHCVLLEILSVIPTAKFTFVTAILDGSVDDFLLVMGSAPGWDVLDFIGGMKCPPLKGSEHRLCLE